jgi:hypothetical protein
MQHRETTCCSSRQPIVPHSTEARRGHCPTFEETVEFAPGNAVASE